MVVVSRVLLAILLDNVDQEDVVPRCIVLHASIVSELAFDHRILGEIDVVVVFYIFIHFKTKLKFLGISQHFSFLETRVKLLAANLEDLIDRPGLTLEYLERSRRRVLTLLRAVKLYAVELRSKLFQV